MDTKHQIVLSKLWSYLFDGTDYDYFNNAEDVDSLLDACVDDMADEDYDCKVFPIIATPRIRDTLNYQFIADVLNETAFHRQVEYMFYDEDEWAYQEYPDWMLKAEEW